MSHRLPQSSTTFVGLDVHKSSITSAVLAPEAESPVVDRIFPDDPSITRLVKGLGDRRKVAVCYEAGPTGYALARLPHRSRRSHPRPVPGEERPRHRPHPGPSPADQVLAPRHNVVFRDGTHWTMRHEAWLAKVRFDDEALTRTYARYRSVLSALDAELTAVESDLKCYLAHGPFTEAVARLACYRGVTELGALALAAEVGDWTRFARATSFMGFCGLTPAEYSSGERVRRGRITKTGNVHLRTALVEAAWSYQHRPATGAVIRQRQARASDETIARAWGAQVHLTAKFRRLSATKGSRNIVVTAVARELDGFLWAEMTAACCGSLNFPTDDH